MKGWSFLKVLYDNARYTVKDERLRLKLRVCLVFVMIETLYNFFSIYQEGILSEIDYFYFCFRAAHDDWYRVTKKMRKSWNGAWTITTVVNWQHGLKNDRP